MPKNSYLFNAEPMWRINRPGMSRQVAPSVQSWVYESGSLTQRLRNGVGNALQVSVLFHHWQKPFFSETRVLQLPPQQRTLVREVLLSAADKPLIIARTIIPASTLKGAQRNLSRLGNRPLGEVIFSYPKLHRLEMDYSCIDSKLWTDSLQQKVSINESVWGRRTVYSIKGHEMLVNEFFLPELLDELI